MARFSRIEVALKMKETGMIPVFYNADAEVCKKLYRHVTREVCGCLNSPTEAILPHWFLLN
jgi:hypothetical protein